MTEHDMVPIGELVVSPDTWNPTRVDGDTTFTYIDLTAVDQTSKVIAAPRQVLISEAPSRARQVVARRDVLVSTVRPNLNAVAVVPATLDKAIASTGFCVLRPNPTRLDSSYLFHWVKTPEFVAHMVQRATGASYPAVSDRIVRSSEIPLPPVPEQQRIAAILDHAEILQSKRRAALGELDALTQSVFLDIIGDPVANPHGWPRAVLGDLLTFQQYGHRFYNQPYSSDGIRVVRITDLSESGDLDFTDMPRQAVTQDERTKLALQPGDLIFARSGSVGKVALIRPGDPECIAGAYFITMRFDHRVEPTYMRAVLASRSIRSIISAQARQAVQQNFSGPALRRLPVPLPPLELQRSFARHLAKAEALKAHHEESLRKLDALLSSLRHRAFRGEL